MNKSVIEKFKEEVEIARIYFNKENVNQNDYTKALEHINIALNMLEKDMFFNTKNI